ncbi:PA2169 family four-helix-bundle protein [Sulfitobacter aestuariivivens]|uniref:PA2169 family four-helix-bundle protein n=1 Tax=Sulfitobacter aestuariivivens TaxID=2766981 RepID=A0A927D6V1_9RHOB|nr:PA2169 family four-helix-bundle protein [Sulfitobacter aestuariivivens]MBD3664607.1 PA2169 family four-helix-bundle protein [Sulfitobacter aestuariivivens]
MSQSYAKLKELYTRLVDSRDGYEQAFEHATETYFKPMLAELKTERAEFAAAVRADLRKVGENVDEEGSILAGLHRSFLGVRDAVTGQDDDAIKAEIARGEEHLKKAYEAAVEEADGTTQATLMTQKHKVDQAIERVEARENA